MLLTDEDRLQGQILKGLLSKDFFDKYSDKLPESIFSKDTKKLLHTIKEAHGKYQRDLSLEEVHRYHISINPMLTEAQKMNVTELFAQLGVMGTVGADIAADILELAWVQARAQDIAQLGIDMMNGENAGDKLQDLKRLVASCEERFTPKIDIKYEDMSIEGILKGIEDEDVWNFNIPALAQMLPGVSPTHFVVCGARPNVGKCLVAGSLVIMQDGTRKKVEDIVVGDKLLGIDGNSRTVLSLGSGEENAYKIMLRDGSFFECNESHILSLKRKKTENKHNHGDILNINLVDYMKWTSSKKLRYSSWRSPSILPEQKLNIDPWLLGVWLGDGTSNKPEITSADAEIINEIDVVLRSNYPNLKLVPTTYKYTYRIKSVLKGDRWNNKNNFVQHLTQYNLLNNKHIPYQYMLGSIEQRLNLLSGLLDTDGYYANGIYEITQKNAKLSNDIVSLAHSLGMACRITPVIKSSQNGTKGVYYKIRISPGLTEINTVLEYKRHTPGNYTKDSSMQCFTVAAIGVKKYYGFTLDGDHLFMVHNNIVTHNTSLHATLVAAPGGFAWQGAKVHVALNEEAARRVARRYLTSATGLTLDVIKDNPTYASTLYEPIRDKLHLFTANGWSINDLDRHLEKHKPDILIVDMLDKLRSGQTFARRDQELREVYLQARELGKTHECVIMGFSQLSADAEGITTLSQEMLEESKTGKAAEADLMVLVGKKRIAEGMSEDDPMRYINIAKNKINGIHGMRPAKLRGDIGRYIE